jgi:hypothetical protein
MVLVTTIPDDVLITINSLEILGIIYLAIAVSKLRADIAKLQGINEALATHIKNGGSR